MTIVSLDEINDESFNGFSVFHEEELADRFEAFLMEDAREYHNNLLNKTYVFLKDESVKGYVTLCTGTVNKKDVNQEVSESMRYSKFPAILIGKLVVDKTERRNNIGSKLYFHSLNIVLNVVEKIGARFLMVHSLKFPAALDFYKKLGFINVKDNGNTFTMVIDLMKLIESS